MARIRTIEPAFWDDEKIARLTIPCRLFYIGTWNLADDAGVIRANPALLKSKIFPYDETLRVSEVQKYLDALVEVRMLVPVIHKGESYYVIRTFRSHQKFDARYPNYLIDKNIIDKMLNAQGAQEADPLSTQWGHGGDTTGTRHGKGKGEREENIPPLSPLRGECARFVPPTMEQVAAYVAEQGYAVNAGEWCDFYTSKGWMVGKTKMKDWQAAVRTWQRRIDAEQKTKNNSGLCR